MLLACPVLRCRCAATARMPPSPSRLTALAPRPHCRPAGRAGERAGQLLLPFSARRCSPGRQPGWLRCRGASADAVNDARTLFTHVHLAPPSHPTRFSGPCSSSTPPATPWSSRCGGAARPPGWLQLVCGSPGRLLLAGPLAQRWLAARVGSAAAGAARLVYHWQGQLRACHAGHDQARESVCQVQGGQLRRGPAAAAGGRRHPQQLHP